MTAKRRKGWRCSAPGLYLLALGLILFQSSCTFFRLAKGLKAPDFRYRSYEVTRVDGTGVDLVLSFEAVNPNAVGLKNLQIDFELFAEKKRFLTGKDVQVALPPQDSARIAVPVRVVYRDAFRAMGPAAAKLASRASTLPVRVDAVLEGVPTLYNERESGSLWLGKIQVSRTVQVPLDGLRREMGNGTKRFWKSLF